MNNQNTDLTFFINDETGTLLDRFKATLQDTQLFDVLVGYKQIGCNPKFSPLPVILSLRFWSNATY